MRTILVGFSLGGWDKRKWRSRPSETWQWINQWTEAIVFQPVRNKRPNQDCHRALSATPTAKKNSPNFPNRYSTDDNYDASVRFTGKRWITFSHHCGSV